MSYQLIGELIINTNLDSEFNINAHLPEGFYDIEPDAISSSEVGIVKRYAIQIDQAVSRGFNLTLFLNDIHVEGVTAVVFADTHSHYGNYSFDKSHSTFAEVADNIVRQFLSDIESNLEESGNNISWF